MERRRPARIASVIQEEVSRRLLSDVKEPQLGSISITGVIVSPDLTVARIQYLPLGGKGHRPSIQAALEQFARQIRGPVGRALGTRHAPELRFEIDKNIEYAAHIEEVMRHLPPPAAEDPADPAAESPEGASAGDVAPVGEETP